MNRVDVSSARALQNRMAVAIAASRPAGASGAGAHAGPDADAVHEALAHRPADRRGRVG